MSSGDWGHDGDRVPDGAVLLLRVARPAHRHNVGGDGALRLSDRLPSRPPQIKRESQQEHESECRIILLTFGLALRFRDPLPRQIRGSEEVM